MNHYCEVIIDEEEGGLYGVEISVNNIRINLWAKNVDFIQQILSFVETTKNNPEWKNKLYVNCALLSFKQDVWLEKDTDFDDTYILHANSKFISSRIEMSGDLLNLFIGELKRNLE